MLFPGGAGHMILTVDSNIPFVTESPILQ